MLLRPYQSDVLDRIRDAYRQGRRAPLLCSPTGSGKSAMVAYMLGRTRKRTLILAHRAELVEMISAGLPVPHGVITAGRPTPGDQIMVGMMPTVARRLDDLPRFDWVISDECHLSLAPTWSRILDHYKDAHHLGMSATPCRLDGRGLGEIFDTIVYGPSVRELTSRGYLSPLRAFAPAQAVERIKKVAREFSLRDGAAALDRAPITGSAIEHYQRHAAGRRAIVFCCTVEHAEHVAAEFTAAGIPAASVDGGMSKADRVARLAAHRDGRIRVLTNVDLVTTGHDDPGIGAAIFLRPTDSLALFLQAVGRVLRVAPGKDDAILLDHVGNVLRHGMPDAPREFTLDGRLKRTAAPTVRQCPQCWAAFAPAPRCVACGYVFPIAAKPRNTAANDGTLAQIDDGDVEARQRRLREAPLKELLREARTREALEEIRKARGYHHAWTGRMLEFKAAGRARFAGRAA